MSEMLDETQGYADPGEPDTVRYEPDQGYYLDQAAGAEGYDGGYEDYGEGAAEPWFDGSPDGFADVEQALADALEVGLVTPAQVGEYVRASTQAAAAATLMPLAEGLDAWQADRQLEQAAGTFLDYVGNQLDGVNVPEGRLDEAPEAIYDEAARLYGPQREQLAAAFARQLAEGGVERIPDDQLDEVIAHLDWLAWTAATDRAISGWVRSLDPDAGVPKNYSVANRLAREGPLPSTIKAAREQGWDPGPLRSPAEAVRAHDYRKSGSVTSRMFGNAPVWE